MIRAIFVLAFQAVTHPILLPLTGWAFAWIVRRELEAAHDLDTFADHVTHYLIGGLVGAEGAERRLRKDPGGYREQVERYLDSRLPWLLPAELVEPVRERTMAEVDRRTSFFAAIRVDGSPVP